MKKNIGIISQARMTSTRFPGKILREIKGKPMLHYHVERLKRTGHDVIIATTTNSTDDILCEFADMQLLKFHRGSETNVLRRYFEAAAKFQYDIIVRVTSDCPLIDPILVKESIEKYVELNDENLYMSNAIERTFARGFDFEIFSFESLRDAMSKAKDASDLEHVTPYIWKNKSGKIKFSHVKQEIDHSFLRVTVDTAEDFKLVDELITRYDAANLSCREIENILLSHPELTELNSHITQKSAN